MSSDRNITATLRLRELMRRLTTWFGRHQGLKEVEQLGAEEAAAVAREIGTSVPELRGLAGKWPDASEDLLASRLRALKLDPAAVAAAHPAVARDLARLCTLCTDKRQCRDDLEERPNSPAWQSYCPNTSTLNALRQEQPASSKRKP